MITRALLRDAPSIGHHPLPEPRDLSQTPELAILALLDETLETTTAALAAANPELADDPFEHGWGAREATRARVYAADAVIYVTHALRCAIDRYRCAIRDRSP